MSGQTCADVNAGKDGSRAGRFGQENDIAPVANGDVGRASGEIAQSVDDRAAEFHKLERCNVLIAEAKDGDADTIVRLTVGTRPIADPFHPPPHAYSGLPSHPPPL